MAESLFASRAKRIVQTSYLEAKQKAEDERMDEAQEKLDLYTDDYEDIIRDRIQELFAKKNYERLYYHVNQSQNILKRVVKEISTLYKTEAQRTLSGECKRYEELKEQVKFDVMLKKVNRYTNLMNETMLKIGVRDGKIAYDIITPNICMVVQNEADPTQADAILYSLTRVNTLLGKQDIFWFYWDIEGSHYVLNEDFKIVEVIYDADTAPSPYFDTTTDKYILPFVTFHRDYPDYTFWDQHTGRDLYNANLAVGVNMTLLDYYFKVCSVKQVYIVGDTSKVPSEQILDPLSVFSVPAAEGATVGTLDMQINMEQLVKQITFQINGVINNYGISADQYSLQIAEMSGRALKIRNRALMEIREEQMPLYRDYEDELYQKTKIVNNAYPRLFKKMKEKLDFSIDFGEIEFPDDPMDEIELQTKKLRSGIISLGKFYQFFNPDITDEEEAAKVILENLKNLQELKEKYPNIDETLNYILGEGWKKEREPGAGEEEEKEEE